MGKNKPKILLAEDDPINQKVIVLMLELMDWEVVLAQNGRDVIDKYKESEYDVILMDCNMPIIDGYEASRIIRQIESTEKRTPIIAITGSVMQADKEACINAGMDDYLEKPVRRQTLYDCIQKWLTDD